MKTCIINIFRRTFTTECTLGEMWVNGSFFGYTLEDVVRADGVKIFGETAIPDGTYPVTITMSNRFKKRLPELHYVPNFKYIRIHGGNDSEDTEGCILVAKNKGINTIWDRLDDELVKVLEQYDKIYCCVCSVVRTPFSDKDLHK